MKQSIKWHEECLKNSMDHAQRTADYAERQVSSAEQAWRNCEHLAAQIKKAKEQAKDGFDSERFMVKKS